MTETLFRKDAYLQEEKAVVLAHTDDGGIIVDRSLFYPTGGGQPGDKGHVSWHSGQMEIATTIKAGNDQIALVPADPSHPLPSVGIEIRQELNWECRYRHMRIHTALHLLSVVIPLPVTGGAISTEKGRLDFDMPEAPENKEALQEQINALVKADLPVSEEWITDAELAANPGLVKTMSVKPPMGAGQVRLIRVGQGDQQVDLQPCGGTHVARTSEIGTVTLGKIEKKGRQNRRVTLLLDD